MFKKGIKIAALFLMGVVLAVNLLTMALSGLGLRDRLNWLPGALLTVNSGSMEPVLSEGDLLFVWETPYDELEIGDLVTFHGNNELITHQIIREDGSRFVTRGVANDMEDPSIGPEEYCAKVALILPGAGRALEILTDPGKLALLAVLVLALVYGPPVLIRLARALAGEKSRGFRIRPLRLMGTGVLISLLCITPFVTAAKYTANINEYASVTAGVTYFTSNYLSEEGNNYSIAGWGGKGYGISLYMRNYENDLLFNKSGYDLKYQVEFKILNKSPDGKVSYKDCYTVKLLDGQNNIEINPNEGDGKYGPFTIEGGDTKQDKHFEVQVTVDENATLLADEMIRFQIIASTTSATDFDRELVGDFTLVVARAGSFLGERTLSSQAGSALVTYSLKTELVEGATTRYVKVTWDSSKMYLNVYESTAANLIAKNPTQYSPGNGTNVPGYLIMPLQAYSNVNLQFFKYASSTEVGFGDFTCTEVVLEQNKATT